MVLTNKQTEHYCYYDDYEDNYAKSDLEMLKVAIVVVKTECDDDDVVAWLNI